MKLLLPRAGCGALAPVVVTAWLRSPLAAAAPELRPTTPVLGVTPVLGLTPGIGAFDVAPGAVLPGVVAVPWAIAVPASNVAASASEMRVMMKLL